MLLPFYIMRYEKKADELKEEPPVSRRGLFDVKYHVSISYFAQ